MGDIINMHPCIKFKSEIIKLYQASATFDEIAKELNLKIHHILNVLRKNSLLKKEILKEDLIFIANYSEKLPRSLIAEILNLPTQTIWRQQQKHNLKNIYSSNDFNLSIAGDVFKFLIEDDWNIQNIEGIPQIINKTYLQGGYYSLYKFCLQHIKKTKEAKPVLGLLAEIAYPNKLRSFQFNLPNNTSHFKNVSQLNEALWWSFEKMTGLSLDTIANDKNSAIMFLNEPKIGFSADNLLKNYIARKEWNKFYSNFKKLKEGMATYIGLSIKDRRRHSTRELRLELEKKINLKNGCEICKHKNNLEIHHIIPVAKTEHLFDAIEINSADNLILLCPNHHKQASRFWFENSKKITIKNARKKLKDFLKPSYF